ncbi:SDR family oxidoreductase [Leptospira sp. 201903070]|uniref:SDR family oxidoreductase n=1 Tax=Leptospira ainlahdjerensis TaxID=2810033 RepID=A0ABS2UA93_9LEPT|nr:SDR family oxidoreductase [Leptospira ainlahdjerensis]MBM9577297.1 SDR family oxidoreductase [Leptospira ainlahdjerensis]
MEINSAPKKLLITGASGYLGGRIVKFFAESEAWSVIVAQRESKDLFNFTNCNVRSIDWDDFQSLRKVCAEVFAVVHLAGMNAQDSAIKPTESYKVNTVNTGLLLEAAIIEKVNKFIYFSTAHVYASPLVGFFSEDTPTNNFHPYAASHKAAEDITRYYASLGKIDGYVIRLSNAYGPPLMKETNCWTLLVNDLCRQAVEEKKMKLRSNGLQKRDFIPIHGLINALHFFLSDNSSPNSSKIFNLGGDWAITVWEMAQTIQSRCEIILGYKPALERNETGIEKCKIENLHYSIDKLKEYGIQPAKNRLGEIDALIRFCVTHFSSGRN